MKEKKVVEMTWEKKGQREGVRGRDGKKLQNFIPK